MPWEAKQSLEDQLNQFTGGTEEETAKNTEVLEKEQLLEKEKLLEKASEEGVSEDLKQMMKAMMDKLDLVVANQQSAASSSASPSQPPQRPEPAHPPPGAPAPTEPHPPQRPPQDQVMCLG